MKKQFRTAMLSTACMLIVAVMSLTGVTYAWFTAGNDARIDGMDVTVTSSDGGIEIWNETTNEWASRLTMSTGLASVKPVSTANGTTFFEASVNAENSSQIVSSTANPAYYYTKTLRVRNTGSDPITVNLAGTTITAKEWVEGESTFENTDIFGAARIYIKYTIPAESEGGDATVVEYFFAPHDSATYYGIKEASKGKGEKNTDVYFTINAANEAYTKAITPVGATDCEIELPASGAPVDVYIAVWLEGQDPDCNNDNAGGAFDIVLQFTKVTG